MESKDLCQTIRKQCNQKQPPKGVPRKRCSENMQQIYRRTPMSKCDFNLSKLLCNFIEITLRHACSPVDLLHIFRTPFLMNTCGWLLLYNTIMLYERWRIYRLLPSFSSLYNAKNDFIFQAT